VSTPREHLTAGVDPGTSAVKVAITRSRAGEEGEILAKATQRIRRRELADVVVATFADACAAAGVDEGDFDYIASTGDGEAVALRTGHFYSVTTHARGAAFLEPEARAALDVGALHARALRMGEGGRVLSHKMTSQCASGSGQFVENIARYLGVALEDVGSQSKAAAAPETCSSICAVLAETDVINMVSRGIGAPDILKGIHLSIAGRLVKLLRATGATGVALITGGLAQDQGLIAAMEEILAEAPVKKAAGASSGGSGRATAGPSSDTLELRTHPDSVYAGAIGAGLLAAYRCHQLEQAGRLPAA
jgi:benzoyl-CoA reductase subunit D